MSAAEALIGLEDSFESGVYTRQPLVLVRGEAARVWDSGGREHIDCVAGHGVANVGHANPEGARPVAAQAQRLTVCANGFYNDQRAGLLARLADISPVDSARVFMCNSGAEAVEAALKFA